MEVLESTFKEHKRRYSISLLCFHNSQKKRKEKKIEMKVMQAVKPCLRDWEESQRLNCVQTDTRFKL